MTEYSNTVQLAQGKGVDLVASATETLGSSPPGEAAEYVTTWHVHRLARHQQTDDDWGRRFTIFALVDALTRLAREQENAGDRTDADEKASALLALAA